MSLLLRHVCWMTLILCGVVFADFVQDFMLQFVRRRASKFNAATWTCSSKEHFLTERIHRHP